MELYKHQRYTADFIEQNPRVFVTSDAGTGKTASVLNGFSELKSNGQAVRMLVLAPLSILTPAWVDDCQKFTPHLSIGTSTSGSEKKRTQAFSDGCDIVVTNHDAVKWLVKNKHLLDDFDMLVIDESTAYKHRTSARSKAARELAKLFNYRVLMTATPTSNTVCDIWHQAMILDDGERLGRMFHGFRMQVCEPVQNGPNPQHIKWIDKAGAEDVVAERLRDITVRFKFEDCIDVPEHTKHTLYINLSPEVMKLYRQLEEEAVLMHEQGVVNAIHAGSKVQKLLQLCSGAVYDGEHEGRIFHTERYELVMQLVAERKHSIVAFNWTHQRDELVRLAKKMDIKYAVIDGSVPVNQRTAIVEAYQAGKLQVIFAHPQSAGHGLTLTKGTTTIWASPTYNGEWFQQFNARIYRAGQTQRTETIMIAARGTRETDVYEKLSEKIVRMDSLLDIFKGSTEEAA